MHPEEGKWIRAIARKKSRIHRCPKVFPESAASCSHSFTNDCPLGVKSNRRFGPFRGRNSTLCSQCTMTQMSYRDKELIHRPMFIHVYHLRKIYYNLSAMKGQDMRVLFASSETHPLARSGGLADISSAPCRSPLRNRASMSAPDAGLSPGHRPAGEIRRCDTSTISMGVCNATLISGQLPDSEVPVWLLMRRPVYDGPVGPYQNSRRQEWPDNA